MTTRACAGAIAARRVFVATSVEEIGRAAWERLAAASAAPVFYGWDFIRAIEQHPLTAGARPHYVVIRGDGATLDAVAVLYSQVAVNPFATVPVGPEPMLVGHLWHCYDTRVLSAGPLTRELVEAVRAAIDLVGDDVGAVSRGLHNIDATGPLAEAVAAAGGLLADGSPRYRLSPRDIDAHLATIGRASRRSLRQYARRAVAAGARITFRPAAESLDDDVLALCRSTANKHAPGYYPSDELARLLIALGDACRILRLDLDGALLAVSVCLFDDRAAHFWAGGSLYPRELNWSPQYVLFGAELAHGFASERPMVEFGRRGDEFKLRYGLQPVRLRSWVWDGGAR